jgi:hypothetical protein
MRVRRAIQIQIAQAAILLSILACAVTGPSTQGAPPLSDPEDFAAIVAGTAAALATQTAQVAPPPATPTPLPTGTATAVPVELISSEGTSLRKEADGSFLFSDHLGGYQLVIPSGWLALRVNEQETMNAWALPEASNPNVQTFLSRVQASDPKVFRLFGLDILPEHLQRSYGTNFSVLLDRTNSASLESLVEDLKKQLPTSLLAPKIIRAEVDQTSAQIPIGIVEMTSDAQSTSGESLNLYQKQAVFVVKGGALAITFSTTADLKDLLLPMFDGMVDRLTLLEQ